MANSEIGQAIETLRGAGFNVSDDGLVTSGERGKWGTVRLEAAMLNGEPRVHASKEGGKPSGRFLESIREALGALYA